MMTKDWLMEHEQDLTESFVAEYYDLYQDYLSINRFDDEIDAQIEFVKSYYPLFESYAVNVSVGNE
jgi:hypothetical protein